MTADDIGYRAARLQEALATDERVAELGLEVAVRDDDAYISGNVSTQERRDAVSEIAREQLPGLRIHNQITVTGHLENPDVENLT